VSNRFSHLGGRFKNAIESAKNLASEISKHGAVEYSRYMKAFDTFVDIAKDGVVPMVIHPDQVLRPEIPTLLDADDGEAGEVRKIETQVAQPAVLLEPAVNLAVFSIRSRVASRPRGRPAEGRKHHKFNKTKRKSMIPWIC